MLQRHESLSAEDWWAWLKRAREGDCIAYHRGLLGASVSDEALKNLRLNLGPAQRADIAARADLIRTLVQWSAGLRTAPLMSAQSWFDPRLRPRVDLYQMRIADEDCLYLARAREYAGLGLEDEK